jgi:hypothetical protein
MSTHIDLFDPKDPSRPRRELSLNFSPAPPPHGEGHVRWARRPAAAPIDWAGLRDRSGEPLIPRGAAEALSAAGAHSVKDVLALGEEGLRRVPNLSRKAAGDVWAHASNHPAAKEALAEIAAEAAPTIAEQQPAPKVPDPAEHFKPEATETEGQG